MPTETAKPTSIRYVVEPCMLGPNATDDDCHAYATALGEALSERWPDADIEVSVSLHTHGAKSCRIETDDYSSESEIYGEIMTIAERVLCHM